jgi:hypothetical protein
MYAYQFLPERTNYYPVVTSAKLSRSPCSWPRESADTLKTVSPDVPPCDSWARTVEKGDVRGLESIYLMPTSSLCSKRQTRLAALLLSAVTASALLTACSGDEEGAACPLVLSFEGHDYSGVPADQKLPGTKKVGMGELPGCSDTNGGDAATEPVEVWELKGVDPEVAVGAELGDELQLFVVSDEEKLCAVKYTRCTGEN